MATDSVQRRAEAQAQSLRALLAAIDAGELRCSTATRYRLEGAAVALESLLGDLSDLLPELGLDNK